MGAVTIVVRKVWRSELVLVGFFVVTLLVGLVLTSYYPGSIMPAFTLPIGEEDLVVSLPVFLTVPFVIISWAATRIYDVRYTLDAKGLEARQGVLALRQTIQRVRYEDIRGIEVKQNLLERALDIGRVEVGTASNSGVEVVLDGVGTPYEVQKLLQNERDQRAIRVEAKRSESKKVSVGGV